jgi:hypothetical protein
MVLGLGVAQVGWLFFRRPGVALLPLAAAWKAHRRLTSPGALLWIAGCFVYFVGVFWFLIRCLMDFSGGPR